jgi:hypothetical protein
MSQERLTILLFSMSKIVMSKIVNGTSPDKILTALGMQRLHNMIYVFLRVGLVAIRTRVKMEG